MEIFTYIAEAYIAVTFVVFALTILDLYRHPQLKGIMDGVWAITVLWSGPVGFIGYVWFGRSHLKYKRKTLSKKDKAQIYAEQIESMKNPQADAKPEALPLDAAGEDETYLITINQASKAERLSDLMRAHRKAVELEYMRYGDMALWKRSVLSVLFAGAICAVGNIVGEYLGIEFFHELSIYNFLFQWLIDAAFVFLSLILIAIFLYETTCPEKDGMQRRSRGELFKGFMKKEVSANIRAIAIWEMVFFCISGVLMLLYPDLLHNSPLYWFNLQFGMYAGCLACSFIYSKDARDL